MEAQKRRHLEADHDKQSSKAEKKDIQVSNGERREGKRERKGGGREGERDGERERLCMVVSILIQPYKCSIGFPCS